MPPTFIGREREVDAVDALLRGRGLATVLGTAGTGKTRLALEWVRRSGGSALWVRPSRPVPAAAQGRIVVLDGLAPDAVAREVVARLAERGPVLVTSREAVGLPGERVLALPPLSHRFAVALVQDRLGPLEPEEAEALAALADGLPGAIVLMARAAGRVPPSEVVRSLSAALDGCRARGLRLPRSATMALVERWARSGEACSV